MKKIIFIIQSIAFVIAIIVSGAVTSFAEWLQKILLGEHI